MQLSIVILNYRTSDLTIKCLRSLEPEVRALPSAGVVVVDNASGDDSVEQITSTIEQENWHGWVALHVNGHNAGFAGGNNLGWNLHPDARYVLLLNSDTVVHPGCLRHCVALMERDAAIGAMSCLVLNQDGSVQNVCRRFPTPLNQFMSALGLPFRWPRIFGWANTEDLGWDRRAVSRDVHWIGGAFLLARGDLVRRIGFLDESFFFYGEDVEFCHRVWRAGFRVHYDPRASITHLGGASSDPVRLPQEQRTVHRWKARYLVQLRCYGRWAAACVKATDLLSYRLKLLRLRLFSRRDEGRYAALQNAFQALRSAQ